MARECCAAQAQPTFDVSQDDVGIASCGQCCAYCNMLQHERQQQRRHPCSWFPRHGGASVSRADGGGSVRSRAARGRVLCMLGVLDLARFSMQLQVTLVASSQT